MRVNKQTAISQTNVFDEKIGEQGRFSHAAHAFNIDMFRGVDEELLSCDRLLTYRDVHGAVRVPAPIKPMDHIGRGRGDWRVLEYPAPQYHCDSSQSTNMTLNVQERIVSLGVVFWRFEYRRADVFFVELFSR